MAVLALVLLVAWLLFAAGLRGYLHYRRTGEVRGPVRDQPGSPQWWARLIGSLGLLFAFSAPVAELAGLAPVAVLDLPLVQFAGAALVVLGIAGTLAGQSAMGDSWRPDVDPDARSALVTTGPFRLVRNPILTATAMTALGLALMVPNLLAALMLAAVVAAQQIQVRLVEEPHLLRVHGDACRRYAARTGRFLPWVGRLPSNEPRLPDGNTDS